MSASRVLNNAQVIRAALIVLLGFLTSGLLGLVRLGIVSSAFGTTEAADAFLAAQRLPETIFTLVAGGALGSSFIPVFARLREKSLSDAWRLASATMTLSAVAAGVLGVVVILFAEPIARQIIMPGRSAETQTLTANLMRLMMVTPVIFSVSGLVMGILQANGMFLLPSIAISMNNIGIIVGAWVLSPLITSAESVAQVGDRSIYGLAYGAVLSAVLHLAVQLPGLWRLRAPLRPLLSWRVPGVRDVLWLMLPRTLGLAVVQVNFIVNLLLASSMASGAVTALNTAFMLMFFALGIIGQSVGSAVFPTLAALHASGDLETFRQRLNQALRGVLFLAFPAMAAFIVLGEPLVSLFERGAWTAESTQATAWALALYAVGMPGFVLLEVLSRAFYSLEDTWTPVWVGTLAMIANIILSVLLSQVIGSRDTLAFGAFGGLALANALTTNVEAVALWGLLRRRMGAMNDAATLTMLGKLTGATLISALVMWAVVSQFAPPPRLGAGIVAGVMGAGAFFGVALLLRIEEAVYVPRLVLQRLRR
ncbi:murein biosynthesis integral membrane protein MurJ [Aggregatilineales bacterium SYSU G02658]